MVKIMEGLRLRLQLSAFLFLHRDREWLAACKRIHDFLDAYTDKAVEQLHHTKLGKPARSPDGRPRNDFLWTIAGKVPDRLELRTQLTGVWIPSNETTSIFLSSTLYTLARDPEIVNRLRKEMLRYGDQPLTFTGLRSLTYLRWILNESKTSALIWLGSVEDCI
jgi:cytochrome P450 monooxygenase